jgi:hypothetical protein
MDLANIAYPKYLGLTIMSDSRKYECGEHARFKILEFDYHVKPNKI